VHDRLSETSKKRKQHKHKQAQAQVATSELEATYRNLLTEFVASKQWKQATGICTY
jgi:hypothetical protein